MLFLRIPETALGCSGDFKNNNLLALARKQECPQNYSPIYETFIKYKLYKLLHKFIRIQINFDTETL